jgi:hypothetical protein
MDDKENTQRKSLRYFQSKLSNIVANGTGKPTTLVICFPSNTYIRVCNMLHASKLTKESVEVKYRDGWALGFHL